jgi:hypothetical protein
MSSLREEAKMAARTMSANLAESKAKGEEGGSRSALIVDAQMIYFITITVIDEAHAIYGFELNYKDSFQIGADI